MERELKHYEIAGYLPYKLQFNCNLSNGQKIYNVVECFEKLRSTNIEGEHFVYYFNAPLGNEDIKPILYPTETLYKPTTHNGEEIVPIVEIGRMVDNINADLWRLGEHAGKPCAKKRTSYLVFDELGRFQYSGYNVNSIKLFDYMNELKIDYRGLIDAGLAIDVNTLENNPYK